MPLPAQDRIAALRATLADAAPAPRSAPPIRTGLAALDGYLPGGGLARACLHEIAGSGPEIEHAAAASLFTAGLCAAAGGMVLWVLQGHDLFAPALAGAGLHPDRVIYAEAGRPAAVLLALEDALHHRGLACVVGELSGPLTLTASRRLHLASETAGIPALLLRRSRRDGDPALVSPNAAATRWRVASLPAPPPLAHAPDVQGLARARWRLDLVRCRGGEPRSWIVEACDAQGRLGVPAELSHRPAAETARLAAAG